MDAYEIVEAVEGAFGSKIDYAMLVKVYGPVPEGQRRYSPAECIGAIKHRVEGQSRSQTRFDQLCGATKSEHQNGQPQHDAAHECLF